MVTSSARVPGVLAGQVLPVEGGERVLASVQVVDRMVSSPAVEGSEEAGTDRVSNSKDSSKSPDEPSDVADAQPRQSVSKAPSAETEGRTSGEEDGEEARWRERNRAR
mmetsp:Transcript_45078/g.107133  ORF Transcript_45078/g.107133 Transcript_45078/m.107133 type:complete len:108 (+) Transcript_45078:146-469(+)